MRSPDLDTAVVALSEATPVLLAAPLAQQRAAYDALSLLYPPPEGTDVRQVDASGVPAEMVTAPGARTDVAVMHLHGGGYGIGSSAGYRGLAARLSDASGASVLVPDYRLAPEARFPAALEDASRALAWLVGAMGRPDRVAISGDSAGGGLALSVLSSMGSARHSMPAGAVLWSPWADLSVADDRADGVVDPVLTVPWLQARAADYLHGTNPADPGASPLHADLTGLPALLVFVGEHEILLADARRVAERAHAAGVEATLVEVPGAVHLWMHLVPGAPESVAALERAGRFLADRLRSTAGA